MPQKMFHELIDTQGRSSSIAAEDLYITGFKDGARMMLEVIGERKQTSIILSLLCAPCTVTPPMTVVRICAPEQNFLIVIGENFCSVL